MSFDLNALIRPNVRAMKPYSSARDEFQGEARVMLDANENSLGSAGPTEFNRYPDPHQRAVKQALAPVVEPMAEAEGLHAHAQAVALRRKHLQG